MVVSSGVKVASNSLNPPDVGGPFSQAQWIAGAAQELANGIVQQAMASGGKTSGIGMPASWPYGPIPEGSVRADGTISPLLWSQIQGYVNSTAAQNDTDFGNWLGVQFTQAAPGGLVDKPLTVAEQIALRNQELKEQEFVRSLIGSGASYSSGGTSGYRSSGSTRSSGGGGGGGGGSSGADYASRLAYERQSGAIDLEMLAQKNALNLQYQQALQALQSDPNNPEYQWRARELAERQRQFDQQMAYQQEKDRASLGLTRAQTFAQLAANPNDAVAREYFLRLGTQPLGTPVNVLTGQPGEGQKTLSQVMAENAPLLAPFAQAGMTGTPPPEQPAPATDTNETPQYANGTEITPDGWTRAPKFIAGDPAVPGMPNPEKIQLRVRNGRPEAKVTPLSKMLGGGFHRMPNGRMMRNSAMPMYASGTDPWAWLYEPGGMYADMVGGAGGIDYGDVAAQINETYYGNGGSTDLPSPTTTGATGTQTAAGGTSAPSNPNSSTINFSQPYYIDPRSGVPVQGAMPTTGVGVNTAPANIPLPNGDPYFGTPFAGMKPTDTVLNGNSPWYGESVEDAYRAYVYNAGKTQEFGNPYNVPAKVVGPTADTPGMYYSNGNPRPYIQFNSQADAGILTGAQLSNGVKQSVNPGLPGYQLPYPVPGSQPPPAAATDPTTTEKVTGGVGQTKTTDVGANGAGGFKPGEEVPDLSKSWVLDPTTGQWYEQTSAPAAPPQTTSGPTIGTAGGPAGSVTFGPAGPKGEATVLTGGTVKSPDGGATYTLKPNDVRQADGSYVRYNPLTLTYEPVMPNYTLITSEAQFRALPPDVQQAILSGAPTGYAIPQSVASNLMAGYGSSGRLSDEQIRALPPDQQRALYEGPTFGPNIPRGPARMGSAPAYSPEQLNPKGTFTTSSGYYQPRSEYISDAFGTPTGLLRLPMAQMTGGIDDYSNSFTQQQLAELYPQPNRAPEPPPPPPLPGYLNNPVNGLPFGGASGVLPEGWQYLKAPPQIVVDPDSGYGFGPRTMWVEPDSRRWLISPTGEVYYSESGGAFWFKFADNAAQAGIDPSQFVPATGVGEPIITGSVDAEGNPIPTPQQGGGTTAPPPTGGTTTPPPAGGTGNDRIDTGAPPPATGGTTTPPPAGGTGNDRIDTGAPPPATGGTTTPPPSTGGTTTPPPASGGNNTGDPISRLLGALFGLSYGNDVYAGLPGLQYLLGNLSSGQYENISNAPIEVPALGLTGNKALPSPAQSMNYEMLTNLINNGSFDLLNSLYTAGNVPLSLLLKIAEARAPRGNSYETSLIET